MWLYFISFLLAVLIGAMLVSNGLVPRIVVQIDCHTSSFYWCGR